MGSDKPSNMHASEARIFSLGNLRVIFDNPKYERLMSLSVGRIML